MSSLHGPMDLNSDSDSDDGSVDSVDEPAAVAAATAAQKREQLKAGIPHTVRGRKKRQRTHSMPFSDTATAELPPAESKVDVKDEPVQSGGGQVPPMPPGAFVKMEEEEDVVPSMPPAARWSVEVCEEVEEELEVVDAVEVDGSTHLDNVVTIAVELPLPAGPTTKPEEAPPPWPEGAVVKPEEEAPPAWPEGVVVKEVNGIEVIEENEENEQ